MKIKRLGSTTIGKEPPPKLVVRWIGQAGFVLQDPLSHLTIVIDPYLSETVEQKEGLTRIAPLTIKPVSVKPDVVLCTHHHLDHTDPETIAGLWSSARPVFVGPPSSAKIIKEARVKGEKIVTIRRGEKKSLLGLEILATYAEHTQDSVGYILSIGGVTVYHTGDTEFTLELLNLAKRDLDLMMVCINGRWGNMNAAEAAVLVAALAPRVAVPMHYGMFKENTADPDFFLSVANKVARSSEVVILDFGVSYGVWK